MATPDGDASAARDGAASAGSPVPTAGRDARPPQAPERWDWEPGTRTITDLSGLPDGVESLDQVTVSPDGERFAAALYFDDDRQQIRVNDSTWDGDLEKVLGLAFAPDGRLTAVVRVGDRWTVGVDGRLWEERWDFAWNPRFSADGRHVGVQVKIGMEYTVAVDGVAWEHRFPSCRAFALSADGAHAAAAVQVETLAEADVQGFRAGVWTVAVDGRPWERRFTNVYAPLFRPDGGEVAAEIRTDIRAYTVARDGAPWPRSFGGVWEPCYRPDGGLLAPVRTGGRWALFEDGARIWNRDHVQLWHVRVGGGGRRVAAVVAPSFGRWTVAVDDHPWSRTFGDAVLAPVFSGDGDHVAAVVRSDGRWGVAVDGAPWDLDVDMAWTPVFAPAGDVAVARVSRAGRQTYSAGGRPWSESFDWLADPVFSPGGESVLARGVRDGRAVRAVVPLDRLLG